MKQKAWISILIVILGCIFNLFVSTTLHLLLSGESTRLTLPPLAFCLGNLVSSRSHFLLFLCLQSIVLVLAALFFLTNSQPYQSKLRKVAPGIETPVPTGQHQHGSARWLGEEEWPDAFEHYTLDLQHPLILHLLETGYDDLSFLKSTEQEESGDETAPSKDNSQA